MKEEITWHLVDEDGFPSQLKNWGIFRVIRKSGLVYRCNGRDIAHGIINHYDPAIAWAEMPKGPEAKDV